MRTVRVGKYITQMNVHVAVNLFVADFPEYVKIKRWIYYHYNHMMFREIRTPAVFTKPLIKIAV